MDNNKTSLNETNIDEGNSTSISENDLIENLLSIFDLPSDKEYNQSANSQNTFEEDNDDEDISEEDVFLFKNENIEYINERPKINFNLRTYQQNIRDLGLLNNSYQNLVLEINKSGIQSNIEEDIFEKDSKSNLNNILKSEEKFFVPSSELDMDNNTEGKYGSFDLGDLVDNMQIQNQKQENPNNYDLNTLNLDLNSDTLVKTFEDAFLEGSSRQKEENINTKKEVDEAENIFVKKDTKNEEIANQKLAKITQDKTEKNEIRSELDDIFSEGFEKLNINLENEYDLTDNLENEETNIESDMEDFDQELFSSGVGNFYKDDRPKNFDILKEKQFSKVLSSKSNLQDQDQSIKQYDNNRVEDFESYKDENKEITTDTQEAFDDDKSFQVISDNIDLLPVPLQNIIHDVFIHKKLNEKDLEVLMEHLFKNDQAEVLEFLQKHNLLKKDKKTEKGLGIFFLLKTFSRFLGILILFLLLFPLIKYWNDSNLEKGYQEIIANLDKGSTHYEITNENFRNFYKKNPRLDWYAKYIKKYISIGDPLALYYAHEFLLGKDISNENWKEIYLNHFIELKKNRLLQDNKDIDDVKPDLYDTPVLDQKSKKLESSFALINFDFLDFLRSKLGLETNDQIPIDLKAYQKDEQILNLIIDLFEAKAYWAYYYKDWDNLNFYFQEAIEKGFNVLINLDLTINLEKLNRLAFLYTKWGDTLKEYNFKLANEKYDISDEIYNKLLKEYPENSQPIYGFLGVSISKNDFLKANDFFERLKLITSNFTKDFSDEINIRILNKYFKALLENKEVYSKDIHLKKKILRDLFNILNDTIKLGYFIPEIYYSLGFYTSYNKNYYYALEIYIKGLISFYLDDISKISNFTNQIKSIPKSEYVAFLKNTTKETINIIRTDFNIKRFPLESEFFTRISEAFMKLALSLDNKIFEEEEQRNQFFEVAKKNIKIAIQIDYKNKSAWYNKGNIYYNDFIIERERVFNQFTNNNIHNADTRKITIDQNIKQYYLNVLSLLVGKIDLVNKNFLENPEILDEILIKANLKNIDYGEPLFYYLGYIFYHEKKYDIAYKFWQALKEKFEYYQLNSKLNFALGNVLLYLGDYASAIKNYEKIIDFYLPVIEQNSKHFTSNDFRQVQFFLNLAKVYNNIGLAYHLESEKVMNHYLLNQNLRQKALYYYYRAKEFSSFISSSLTLKSQEINMKKIFDNIVFLETSNIKLANRQARNNIYLQPLKHMIISDIDSSLE